MGDKISLPSKVVLGYKDFFFSKKFLDKANVPDKRFSLCTQFYISSFKSLKDAFLIGLVIDSQYSLQYICNTNYSRIALYHFSWHC